MVFEEYFRDYLAAFAQDDKPLWNYEAGVTLLGAQWLYEVTHDQFYKDRILEVYEPSHPGGWDHQVSGCK